MRPFILILLSCFLCACKTHKAAEIHSTDTIHHFTERDLRDTVTVHSTDTVHHFTERYLRDTVTTSIIIITHDTLCDTIIRHRTQRIFFNRVNHSTAADTSTRAADTSTRAAVHGAQMERASIPMLSNSPAPSFFDWRASIVLLILSVAILVIIRQR